MEFLDKIKQIVGTSEEDYYDDDDMEMEEEDEAADDRREEPEKFVRHQKPQVQHSSNKVVNINTTAQLQVVLVKPERFEDASSIADHLNEKRTIVLNLESAGKDVARRLVDFLSGVAYANQGQLKRVANCTFIITPYNVDVMGDLLDELENNGMFF